MRNWRTMGLAGLLAALGIALSGCGGHVPTLEQASMAVGNPPAERPAGKPIEVSQDNLSWFFRVLSTGDGGAIRRTGELVFHKGMAVPNHGMVFGNYPSETTREGNIRYTLFQAGSGSYVASVSITVAPKSGEILLLDISEAIR